MRDTHAPILPIRTSTHFLSRLRERFPESKWTEGSVARMLLEADWYPAGGRAYYAIIRHGTRLIVLVVGMERGLVDLITVYEPKRGWEARLANARPWPYAIVARASSA